MSGRFSRRMRVLAIALVLLMVGVSAPAESIEVELNTSARVYSSLTATAQSVKAPKGLRVSLRACSKGWGQVVYKGNTGYVRLKYLDRINPLKAFVTRSATVYKDASGSKKLTTLSAGTVVYALGVDGSYVRILNQNKNWKGYIKSGLLSSKKPVSMNGNRSIPRELQATAEGARASKIEKTIYVAQILIGKPCSDDPNPPKSFDCAGYTGYCYGKAWQNILKDTPKSQGYDDRFERIDDMSSLKRGDLVCFNTVEDSDLSDHVGIYLGKGYFLHASSVAKRVIVSQLKSGYYNRVFSWGKRIFS